ncbi:Alpha/Beta hydrolase protein [Obelidium mucronatum]|nr:Alpha/Beta hydrolase protein [Obelidium mucronatum]
MPIDFAAAVDSLSALASRVPPRAQQLIAAAAVAALAYAAADWRFRRSRLALPAPLVAIRRQALQTAAHGGVELLAGVTQGSRRPVLFVHGGYHSARCFRKYLVFLAQRGIPAYAVSMPSHGLSDRMSLFRSLFATPKGTYCNVVDDAVKHISNLHNGQAPILCGHSAGGGLAQIYLNSSTLSPSTVHALVLLAAFPATNGFEIMKNWIRFDPWLPFRFTSIRPPLATIELAHRAFLSDAFDIRSAEGSQFWQELEYVESFGWPLSLISGQFADPKTVAEKVSGRVAVFGGRVDRLMTNSIVEHTAKLYGLEPIFVENCAHDLMLDVGWEKGAHQLLKVLESFH